ncbi:uncharacterized protein SOCE26_076100 [Sorangium cellulosum]|uniref:Uncharacterized protein n=1 Tax=Sorangium cellulosum TaxID=56 RepID=A0A2L0F3G0_SORCE|nr:uncharacterized protein SOCE26_076100 [Sorangium cellulosum]
MRDVDLDLVDRGLIEPGRERHLARGRVVGGAVGERADLECVAGELKARRARHGERHGLALLQPVRPAARRRALLPLRAGSPAGAGAGAGWPAARRAARWIGRGVGAAGAVERRQDQGRRERQIRAEILHEGDPSAIARRSGRARAARATRARPAPQRLGHGVRGPTAAVDVGESSRVEEHRGLLRAIERGNAKSAATLLRAHLSECYGT